MLLHVGIPDNIIQELSELIPNKKFDTHWHEANTVTDDGRNAAENIYNRNEKIFQVTPGCSEIPISPVKHSENIAHGRARPEFDEWRIRSDIFVGFLIILFHGFIEDGLEFGILSWSGEGFR
jgi:hypothetical protein